MSTAICDACFLAIRWKAGRGSSVKDVRCPKCGGAVRGVSKQRGDDPAWCVGCLTVRPFVNPQYERADPSSTHKTSCRVCKPLETWLRDLSEERPTGQASPDSLLLFAPNQDGEPHDPGNPSPTDP